MYNNTTTIKICSNSLILVEFVYMYCLFAAEATTRNYISVDCWESFKQQQRIEKVNIVVLTEFWPEKNHKEMKTLCK